MKTTNGIMLLLLLIFMFTACKTEQVSLNSLDGFSTTRYYTADIISEQYNSIYGEWKVVGTSGGFIGTGCTKDFDYLILKPNAIFGIVRNDSLIAYGKLILLPDTAANIQNGLKSKFDFEKSVNIELFADSEKYIQLAGKDSLHLIAPCCDRYNTHFVRKK
jgi:hypothetical protein